MPILPTEDLNQPASSAPDSVRLACEAMATRFELVLEGDDPARLRAAGEEALATIERVEAKLSFYRPTSDVGRLNARAATEPVRVDAELFELLIRARRLHELTGGAFDVTVGPLMRCWGLAGGGGQVPSEPELEDARGRVGMDRVELDESRRTVHFRRPGMQVDLGAIGKGYALEQAAVLLGELGVESALLHGGTSSVHAIGRPLAGGSWKVAIEAPPGPVRDDEVVEAEIVAVAPLEDRALSVSAVWGKAFEVDGVRYGHVLDPRLGRPVTGALLAAVVCDSATDADALATALLPMDAEARDALVRTRPDLAALALLPEEAGDGFVAWSHRFPLGPGRM